MIGLLGLAGGIWATGYLLFGRFIAPRWKVAGKLGFYLVVVALLHRLVGSWALIWLIGHPLLGIAGHFWWCRRNGINWITCQPRDKYLALRLSVARVMGPGGGIFGRVMGPRNRQGHGASRG
jgi:hypothetical protein